MFQKLAKEKKMEEYHIKDQQEVVILLGLLILKIYVRKPQVVSLQLDIKEHLV